MDCIRTRVTCAACAPGPGNSHCIGILIWRIVFGMGRFADRLVHSFVRRRRAGHAGWGVPVFFILALVPWTGMQAADDEISDYFQQLRARGLFALAESYGRQQLERERLSPALRVVLTCELIQTFAEHASNATERNATELWEQAQATADRFLSAYPDDPQRLLVEAQAAFAVESAAQWQRVQSETTPADRARARQAISQLEKAVESLRSLHERIQERLRQPAARAATSDRDIRLVELRRLSQQTLSRLSSALVELATLLSVDDPRRVEFIVDAQKLLRTLPGPTEDDDPGWDARLLLVRSYRLLNDDARLARQIAAVEKLNPPSAIRDRLLAERIEGLLARKKPGVADGLLKEREQSVLPLTGELQFLRVAILSELYLAAAAHQDESQAARLAKRLEAATEQAVRGAGEYWGRRSAALRAMMHEAQTLGPELAAIVRTAQSQFQEGRVDDAVQSYGKAAERALETGRGDVAFQFGLTRASIELQAKRWDDAAADLEELTRRFPDHQKTPDAHLLYAYALGRTFETSPTKSAREQYTAALEAHRRRFANHASFGEATWMLGQFHERRGQFTSALPMYREVPHDHARGRAAEAAVARCSETILQRLRDLGQPVDPWEAASIEELHKLLEPHLAAPEKWNPDQTEVAVRLTRILLRRQAPDFAQVESWLARLAAALKSLSETPDLPNDQAARVATMQSQKTQLEIMSLAGQHQFPAARDVLRRLSNTRPEEWLFILEGLAPLSSDDKEDPFHDLGELQLEAALALNEQRDKLSDVDQRRLDECLIKAYAAVRKFPQALEVQQRLIAKFPKDKALLADHARLLHRCGARECLQKAAATWRKVQALHPIGTREWFVSQYELCRCLFDLKETAEACKLLKFTRVVYPELGGPELAARFAELEVRCSATKSK